MRSGAHFLTCLIDQLIVLVHLCLLTYTTTLGLGKHQITLPLHQVPKAIKWIFINAPWGIMGVAIPKLAVVIFLGRIVGPSKRKQICALYFVVTTLIILSFVAAVLSFAQCDPPNHAWHPTEEAECWDPNIVANYSLFVGCEVTSSADISLRIGGFCTNVM